MGIRPPVLATYDGTLSAQQALAMAVRLARREGGDLTVLIVADTPETAQRLQSQASDLLRGQGLGARYRRLTDARAATLTHEVRAEGSGVLVLSSTVLSPEALQTLLDEVGCPVLLVR
jgi:nucleotide-binding universal stress UspA family protein